MNVAIELTNDEYEGLRALAGKYDSTDSEYATHIVKMKLQAQNEMGASGDWLETDGLPDGEALSGLEYAADAVDVPWYGYEKSHRGVALWCLVSGAPTRI